MIFQLIILPVIFMMISHGTFSYYFGVLVDFFPLL